MIESRSLASVADAAGLLEGSKHWTQTDREGMTKWLGAFLDWALASKTAGTSARRRTITALFTDVQVAHLALFTGRTDLAREILENAKAKRITAQIKPDGSLPLELAGPTPSVTRDSTCSRSLPWPPWASMRGLISGSLNPGTAQESARSSIFCCLTSNSRTSPGLTK